VQVSVASAAARLGPPTLSIASVSGTRALSVDGDLSDWGELKPPPGSEDVVPEDPFPRVGPLGQGDLPDEVVNAPNPADADVRVGIAIRKEGLLVAVDFRESGLDEVTLGLASLPPRSDSLAYVQGEGDTSDPGPPEPIRMIAAPPSRLFRSELRLSARGVEKAGSEGALAGAVAKADPKRHTLEVTLPNAALPELTEAPLAYLRMAVTAGKPVAEDVRQPPWRWVQLAEPVGYEPYAALREKVMTLVQLQGPAGGAGLSYHPDQPLRIASIDRSPAGFGPLQPMGVLFEKKVTLGDVDVGLGFACAPFVVAMKGGQFHDVSLLTYKRPPEDEGSKQGTLSDGVVKGIVERNDEVHVITFSQAALHTQITGELLLAHWTITRVDRAGTIRSERCELPGPFMERYEIGAGEVEAFADAAFTSFGWRHFGGFELQCRWDAASKSYRASAKRPRKR
jgi:hypothetical protein